jgi:hypothetical protein
MLRDEDFRLGTNRGWTKVTEEGVTSLNPTDFFWLVLKGTFHS